MKKIGLVLVWTVMAMQGAVAAEKCMPSPGADVPRTILKCSLDVHATDYNVTIDIVRGGIAGVTKATVGETRLAGFKSASFYVTEIQADASRPGSHTTFKGQDFELVVKGSVAPTRDGRIYSEATYEFDGQRRQVILGCSYMPVPKCL